MCEPRAAVAWLEYRRPSGNAVENVPLDESPFIVGRSETASLPVDSTRVSREHAVLERRDEAWRIRDLKSTNGTYVNGERIEEVSLHDGDAVKIADIELVFRVNQQAWPAGATQVMTECDPPRDREDHVGWTRALRRMREAMLRGGFPNHYQPVYRLDSRALFGYEALSEADDSDQLGHIEKQIFVTECLLAERLRQVQRITAVEEMAAMDAHLQLLMKLAPVEVGARRVIDSLEVLRDQAGERPLVMEIPVTAVCDTPNFRSFLTALRNARMGVAYDGFAGRGSHAALQPELAPDYVRLASSVTRGVEQSSDRRRQIQAIVRTCQELGCQVMVQSLSHAPALSACRDLGCTLGSGDFFTQGGGTDTTKR
jgi:EAL domain-containing protein (putative c-di-GMP-specific phosphodiesterase class I)